MEKTDENQLEIFADPTYEAGFKILFNTTKKKKFYKVF